MTIAEKNIPIRLTAGNDGDRTAGKGCAGCPLLKVCLPGEFNERERLQFEHIVSSRRRVARHASLFRQDDTFGTLYVVRFGQFKLIGGDRLDAQRVAGFHMAGDLVGMDGIALGRHRFRLMALENSEVCEIPFAAIARVITVEPVIQRRILQAFSAALLGEHEHSRLLSTASLDQRFAQFLLNYSARYARLGYSEKTFRLAMSRGDIGSYLGTTIESVSRLIARFNAHGAVSIVGRNATVHNADYLRALTSGDDQSPAARTGQIVASSGAAGCPPQSDARRMA